jgi:hypothetical protein
MLLYKVALANLFLLTQLGLVELYTQISELKSQKIQLRRSGQELNPSVETTVTQLLLGLGN